jgi:serine phosphatase RsbU (regulator of sigma subunit)
VYRAATRRAEIVEVPGPWLGLMKDLPFFETHRVHLDFGDAICLYSDGLIEARNENEDLYDLCRLQDKVSEALAPAKELEAALNHILEDVLAFSPHLEDDGSLLLVRRKLNE